MKKAVTLLVLLSAFSAAAITARAVYTQEVNQLATRAAPTLSTEGASLTLTIPSLNRQWPAAASAVQLSVSLAGVAGSLPDAGPPTLPDAGPDYLTGGSFQAYRYNPTSGWTRMPTLDDYLPAVAFTDAGSGFPDGGIYGAQVRVGSWTFAEQPITVVGPSDRNVFAGTGVTTAMTSPVDTVTIETVFSDPSRNVQ